MPNPEINREVAEDYRIIPVSSVYGGHRPDHFELIIRTDSVDANNSEDKERPVVRRIDQTALRLTPEQAKSLHQWLGEHIEAFEEQFRQIGETQDIEAPQEGGDQSPMFR